MKCNPARTMTQKSFYLRFQRNSDVVLLRCKSAFAHSIICFVVFGLLISCRSNALTSNSSIMGAYCSRRQPPPQTIWGCGTCRHCKAGCSKCNPAKRNQSSRCRSQSSQPDDDNIAPNNQLDDGPMVHVEPDLRPCARCFKQTDIGHGDYYRRVDTYGLFWLCDECKDVVPRYSRLIAD